MKWDKLRFAAVVNSVLGRQSLNQRNVIVGTLSDTGLIFRFTNGTEQFGPPGTLIFVLCTWFEDKAQSSKHKDQRFFASNGISSKCVIRLNARKRSLISS